MSRRTTLRQKTIALIAALLFLALSLLFSGCDNIVDNLLCDVCHETLSRGQWSINYVDCNGDIKSTVVSIGSDLTDSNTATVKDCWQIIRFSLVPTGN